jgi:spermidine synthase
VLQGDARTVLERQLQQQGSGQFDVLILDAFTSDAIPVHLLTREAVATYWKQLKPDGVLAVHISNAYVDLAPVVRGFAADSGHEAHWTVGLKGDGGIESSFWVAVTSNRAFLDNPEVAKAFAPWPEDARAPILWTDDYTNLYSLLRVH